MLEKGVTFVVISYLEKWEAYMFIGAILCQKNPNWKIIIWHDAPNPELKKIVQSFNDSRIKYIETENRGSWGCFNRVDALQLIATEYVINTTIQEYYLPNAVDEILKYKGADIIYWDTVHHIFAYNILNSELKRNRIDWSNFALKTEIANKIGIKNPTSYTADGEFIEDCVNSGLLEMKVKIPKILSIKN